MGPVNRQLLYYVMGALMADIDAIAMQQHHRWGYRPTAQSKHRQARIARAKAKKR